MKICKVCGKTYPDDFEGGCPGCAAIKVASETVKVTEGVTPVP